MTERPTSQKLLDELKEESTLTETELFNAGIDLLHFVWAVNRKGGKIMTQFPDDEYPTPVDIFVPGLIYLLPRNDPGYDWMKREKS